MVISHSKILNIYFIFCRVGTNFEQDNNVSKCSLYVFTIIPPRLTDQCNFITVL